MNANWSAFGKPLVHRRGFFRLLVTFDRRYSDHLVVIEVVTIGVWMAALHESASDPKRTRGRFLRFLLGAAE